MVSIIVVGRNDDYGINLSKRTAISLNYYASLCESDDEILYVDCNTPAHLPILTEAIADTLTPAARNYLRCHRISGPQMTAAIGETPLPFSDELLRATSPSGAHARRTDGSSAPTATFCFIPLKAPTIAQAIRDIPPKFHVCPRIGIKSEQWQLLDRANVEQIHGLCREIISHGFIYPPELKEPWLRFASNGDFQLAPREQWLAIGGCEEAMKLWGHSDANNARRLALLNGTERTPDVGDSFCVIHLDHNGPKAPGAAPMPQNDWNQWITAVTQPQSHNPENWGLRDIDLPAITLEKYGNISAGDIFATTRHDGFVSRLTTPAKSEGMAKTHPHASLDQRAVIVERSQVIGSRVLI